MQLKPLLQHCVVLTIFLAVSVLAGAQSGNSPSSRTQTVDDWVKENYAAILRTVMPERLQLSPFPRNAKWVAVLLIEEPFLRSEYWISLCKDYSGSVKAAIRVAHGMSLAAQLRQLRASNPNATPELVSRMVQIDSREVTEKEVPGLERLASSLEKIDTSPIAPNFLILDSIAYHYWSQSQYGQEMSAQLVGYGRDAKKQPHPLVEWAEQVRALTIGQVQQRSASNR